MICNECNESFKSRSQFMIHISSCPYGNGSRFSVLRDQLSDENESWDDKDEVSSLHNVFKHQNNNPTSQ